MKMMIALLALLGASPEKEFQPIEADTTLQSVVALDEVGVVAHSPKQHFGLKSQAISSSVVTASMLQRHRVESVKDLSAIIPNFYQPDYGSKMTSSIYVRGFGARIDQPVMGMMVDGVNYLNKNNYDFDMLDVVRVEMLRGPQSTLYGRNTMGGQMNIYTLSPMHYQGVRASAEYSSGNTLRAKASFYDKVGERFAYSLGGYYSRTDGFFDNAYKGRVLEEGAQAVVAEGENAPGSDVDWGESSGGRLRAVWDLGRGWSLDNVANIGYSYEGGYAYRPYDLQSGVVGDIDYNHPSRYMRLGVSDGLILEHAGEKIKFSSTTSYQYTHDKMSIDNDFTPLSYFTLSQQQKEHAFSEDLVLRSANAMRRWQWITGAYGFYKKIDMAAPVTFHKEGIDNLILGNMPAMLKQMLQFENPSFDINSNFDLPTYGLALYHESSLRVGERWRFTAGLRLDYEAAKMEYDNYSALSYRMMPMIPNFRKVEMPFKGEEKLDYLELLPKFAVNFTTGVGNLYATVTRGYKAGGFNTQIFSDILQNKMKSALMSDAMSAMGRPSAEEEPSPYDAASVTTYDPEYSWNYEVGGHLSFAEGRVALDFAAFWIECHDQQLTIFPEGTTTGRMMSNAGHSRSRGAELSALWRALQFTNMSNLTLNASYGYTHAKFVDFNDGKSDYSDNYLPYAPQHTISAGVSYDWWIGGSLLDEVVLSANWQGLGEIYWNESNTLKQDFYSLLNASVELRKGDFSLNLWGKNIADTDYNTFYFMSVGNSFLSQGKPARWGATLSFAM